MKVAYCAEFPLERDRVVGGIEEVVRGLAGTLAKRDGFEVHVLSFHHDLDRPRVEEVDDVHVHRFVHPRRFGNLTLGAQERRETVRALRALAPQIVHPLGLGPKALAAADAGAPWIVSVNGVSSNEARVAGGLKNRLRAWAFSRMENAGLRAAREVIVPNEVVREQLGARLGRARVHTIENAVDERFFELPSGGEPGRIVCIGRLLPLKAPEDLLEAIRRLTSRGRELRVRFVGPPDDPAYLESLRARTRAAGLADRIEFLGFLSDAELRRELAEASILAHPSHVEVAPLSVMQAMAASVPVVATDVGGTRHLVEAGVTGTLVPAGAPDRLASALETLLTGPDRAREMGAAGRRAAERRFRWETVVDRTVEVYESVREAAGRLETTGSQSRNRVEYQGITPAPRNSDGQV